MTEFDVARNGAPVRIMHPKAVDQLPHPPLQCFSAGCNQPTVYRVTVAPMPGFDACPVTFVCAEHGSLMRELHDLVQIRSVTA